MKKLLLAFALFASVAFVGCEKNEKSEPEYSLTITPATAKVGDEVVFTVEGENAADYQWQACYKSTSDSGDGLCWGFNGTSTWTYTVELEAGEYSIHASSKVGGLHTDEFIFTVTE